MHLVTPETRVAGKYALPNGVALRVLALYLQYRVSKVEDSDNAFHPDDAVVWLVENSYSRSLTSKNVWVLFYILLTLWPGQISFEFLAPRAEQTDAWIKDFRFYNELVMINGAEKCYDDQDMSYERTCYGTGMFFSQLPSGGRLARAWDNDTFAYARTKSRDGGGVCFHKKTKTFYVSE